MSQRSIARVNSIDSVSSVNSVDFTDLNDSTCATNSLCSPCDLGTRLFDSPMNLNELDNSNKPAKFAKTAKFVPIVETKDHVHRMVYAGISLTGCKRTRLNKCDDETCGYWEPMHSEEDDDSHDYKIMKFSSRATCYKCDGCGKKKLE